MTSWEEHGRESEFGASIQHEQWVHLDEDGESLGEWCDSDKRRWWEVTIWEELGGEIGLGEQPVHENYMVEWMLSLHSTRTWWWVENNLNMEDEWGRSAACTGELLWGKGVAASIWTPIWTWILHARAMCTQCTVPRRVQDEYELDWGKQHINKTNKDRGGQVESWPRNAKSRTWRMVNVGTWNTVSVEATKG